MPITTEAIRRITIQASSRGVDAATAGLKGLAAAQDSVAAASAKTAAVTDSAAKRQLSAAEAYRRQTLAIDDQARAEDRVAKARRVADAALAQGVITQTDHARRLAMITEKYAPAAAGSRAFGGALNAANDNLRQAAAAGGPVVSLISRLGPGGLAAAAGIAVAAIALNKMRDAANDLADRSGKLVDFAQSTGFTTTQLQALTKVASQVGVAGDQLGGALEKFSVSVEQLRRGNGDLLEGILRVDPALAREMATTREAAAAWDLFAKARAKASETERTTLDKAAFGRSGFGIGRVANETSDAGGLTQVIAGMRQVDVLQKEQLEKWDKLKDESDLFAKTAKDNLTSIFAGSVLESQREYNRQFLELSRAAKEFDVSTALRAFLGMGKASAQTAFPFLRGFSTDSHIAGSFGDLARSADLATRMMGPLQTRAEAIRRGMEGVKVANDNAAGSNENVARSAQSIASEGQRTIAFLGEAATASERYQQRLRDINAAVEANKELEGLAARARADATAAFRLDALRSNVQALGAAATTTEQYKVRLGELQQELRRGTITQDTFNRAIADFRADQELTSLRNNVQALGDAATATEKYRLHVAELQQQLNRGQITQQTFNRAVFASNPIVQELKSNFGDLAKGMMQSMMAGKSFTESLSAGLKNLSMRLAEKSIEQLLSGEFEKALISAASAAVTFVASLFGGGNKKEELQALLAAMDRQAENYIRFVQASGPDTLEKRLHIFDLRANQERVQEARNGNMAREALERALAAERLQIIYDFNAEMLAREQAAAEERMRLAEEVMERQRGFQDRLLEASVDANTLQGQLALFDRRLQREIEAERMAGGQALQDLEAAGAQERLNVIKSYNDKIVEEVKRAAEEQLEAQTRAARLIVDYVADLQHGAASSLAPRDRLIAANETYSATLALARSGNTDALSRVSGDFESVRRAAQALYGSAAAYQEILQTGIQQLLSLPAVVTTTDPVVAAVRDVQVAINNAKIDQLNALAAAKSAADGTTSAVFGTTNAVGGTTFAVGQSTLAIGGATNAVNGVDLTIANGTNTKLQTAVDKFAEAVNELSKVVTKLDLQKAVMDSMEHFSQRNINAINALGQNFVTFARSNHDENQIIMDKLSKIPNNSPSTGGGGGTFWEWLGFRAGGIVGAYAPGGVVGNGRTNVDSVLARYAGGGSIALAGGEGVINQPATAAIGADAIRYINRMRRLPPANDNGASGELRAVRAELAAVRRELMVIAAVVHEGNNINRAGHAANVTAVHREIDALRAEGRHDRADPRRRRTEAA